MPRQRDPTWEYVEDIGGGKVKCKFCKRTFMRSITRMKSHLAKYSCRDIQVCEAVPVSVMEAIRTYLKRQKKSRTISVGSSNVPSIGSGFGLADNTCQRTIPSILPLVSGNQSNIVPLVRKIKKEAADEALVKCLVDNNISFDVLRSETFTRALQLIANEGPGYKAPSTETAETKILGSLKERAHKKVESIRKNWKTIGCTVMSDGWTDMRNVPHINLFAASHEGTVFLKSICISGKEEDANFLSNSIIDAIEESIGGENVVQIIVDNSFNYTMLERKYPHVFLTNCATYCIDLMLEDINSVEHVQLIMENAKKLVKFMCRNQHVYDLIKTLTNAQELKKLGETRFAKQIWCLQYILKQEQFLRSMVAINEWRNLPSSRSAEGEEITKLIQSSIFWESAKEIFQIVEPLVKVLRLVDNESSTLGYLYEAMNRVKEAIKRIHKDDCKKLKYFWDVIENRWTNLLYSPIHATAAFLNPHLFCAGLVKFDSEVTSEIKKVFAKMLPESHKDAFLEIGKYQMQDPTLFDDMAMALLKGSHPRLWWEMNGHAVPLLQKIAIRLHSQPCSVSTRGRHWSAFEDIHTLKTDRLDPQVLQDVVYIKRSLLLQKSIQLKDLNSKPFYIDEIVAFACAEEESDVSTNVEDDGDEEKEGEGETKKFRIGR